MTSIYASYHRWIEQSSIGTPPSEVRMNENTLRANMTYMDESQRLKFEAALESDMPFHAKYLGMKIILDDRLPDKKVELRS